MARKRDYKAEYRRRLEHGRQRGLSVSQARGHPRAGEAGLSPKPAAIDPNIEAAIRSMRKQGLAMTVAAQRSGVAPNRLSRFIKTYVGAEYEGGSWTFSDERRRDVLVLSGGEFHEITVPNYNEAAKAGAFYDAAQRAMQPPANVELLAPFRGKGVTDENGRHFPFETNMNELLRLSARDEPSFEDTYQIHPS